ncbi:MAG: S8 family peptidase [Patescibacteria group bacterium]
MQKWLLAGSISLLALLSAGRVFAMTPNDPLFPQQGYLKRIGAEQAWNVTTGTRDVVVAVIDAGVDINHPDLLNSVWTNSLETPNNGKDDDGNGYYDDIHGWNFVSSTNDIRPAEDSNDDAYIHGTLVSSLIAARGNNGKGIAGVAWNVRIMPIVALDKDGNGTTDAIAKAVRYAVLNGANIINLSIEGASQDPLLDNAFSYARSHGVLITTAAGNSDAEGGINLDSSPMYPACSSKDPSYGVLTVAALDEAGKRAVFSDYGSCVNIAAPGANIFGALPSTVVGTPYSGGWNGTSLATPLVTGAAALIKSVHPDWSPEQVKERLMQTAQPIHDPKAGQLGAGSLDIADALYPYGTAVTGTISVYASRPGSPTTIRIHRASGDIRLAPFRENDARGAHAVIGDMNTDGAPEIAVVPASGSVAEISIFNADGKRLVHIALPDAFTDGGLAAAVDGGFVVADADGGEAWGIDTDLHIWTFHPYETVYHGGMDILGLSGAAIFAPRNGGGRLVAYDVHGNELVSAFPFGTKPSGRWSLARIEYDGLVSVVLSGPAGTKAIPTKGIGQIGWQDVSVDVLMNSTIMQSSGQYANDPVYRLYDTWPRTVADR